MIRKNGGAEIYQLSAGACRYNNGQLFVVSGSKAEVLQNQLLLEHLLLLLRIQHNQEIEKAVDGLFFHPCHVRSIPGNVFSKTAEQ